MLTLANPYGDYYEYNLNIMSEAVHPAAIFSVQCSFYRGSASAKNILTH